MRTRSQALRIALLFAIFAAPVIVTGPLLGPRIVLAQSSQQAEVNVFDVAADPEFKNYKTVVSRFAAKHRPNAVNNFCVIGMSADHTKNAWVLWREGKQIILWEGGGDLDLSRRIIHLPADVVPTESDLHGSTYLVTQSWVAALTTQCDHSGVKVRVGRMVKSQKP